MPCNNTGGVLTILFQSRHLEKQRLCARLERMASLDGKCHDPWAQVDSQSQVRHTDILLSIYRRLQQVLAQPQGSLWAPSGERTDPPLLLARRRGCWSIVQLVEALLGHTPSTTLLGLSYPEKPQAEAQTCWANLVFYPQD